MGGLHTVVVELDVVVIVQSDILRVLLFDMDDSPT